MRKILIVICGMLMLVIGTVGYSWIISETVPEEAGEMTTYMTNVFSGPRDVSAEFEAFYLADTGRQLKVMKYPRHYWEKYMYARISVGEAADVMKAPENIIYLIKKDKIAPLKDLIENSPTMSDFVKRNPHAVEPYTIDGEIYAVGKNLPYTKTIWIRNDLTESGRVDIHHMDELIALLQQGKELGMKPLILRSNVDDVNIFASGYGLRMDIFKKDGRYVEPFFEPEFNGFAEQMKWLADEGLIDYDTDSYNDLRKAFSQGEAFGIVMWDNNYQSLRSKMDAAGIGGALMPVLPFETEKGVFGIEYVPSSEPFVISEQCVHKENAFAFIDWMMTDPEGVIASSTGIFDSESVEKATEFNHLGQSMPPMDRDFEYPFEFSEAMTHGLEYYEMIMNSMSEYDEVLPRKTVLFNNEAYGVVFPKLQDKRNELFFAYLDGTYDYAVFLELYKDFYEKHDMDRLLKEINDEKQVP